MSKMVFLFPGQASQHVGMGKEFYESFSFAREVFGRAVEILGYELSHLCFEGPEDELKMTQNTQPALLVVSYIAYFLFGAEPFIAAGHSLGEYSALVAAGAIKFEDAVLLVHKRGQYMQEAVPVGVGSMAAVIGADYESVKKAVSKVDIGVLAIANWNSREQIVVAGHTEAVEELVSQVDAFKTVILPVSAPFHCTLMKGAEKKLAYDLDYIEFKDLKFPIITNVDAEVIQTGSAARNALKRQVSRTVLWHKSMELLEKEKVDLAIELGSGKVLSALMKRTSRRWIPRPVLLNVEDTESLAKAQQALK